MTALKDSETKVRAYLKWLDNPETVTDRKQIETLEKKLRQTQDPIDKLRIAADLHEARTPKPDELRQAFIDVSKSYADAKDLPAAAFLALGVPETDLKRAGFSTPRSSDLQSKEPRRRMTVQEVKDLVPSNPFSMRELVELSGASTMTVRKAVIEMLDEKKLRKVGPDPDFSGPGRAPERFGRP